MAAAGAQDLAGLKQAMAQFEHCQLKRGARQLVFADGNPDAKIMIVGKAQVVTRIWRASICWSRWTIVGSDVCSDWIVTYVR